MRPGHNSFIRSALFSSAVTRRFVSTEVNYRCDERSQGAPNRATRARKNNVRPRGGQNSQYLCLLVSLKIAVRHWCMRTCRPAIFTVTVRARDLCRRNPQPRPDYKRKDAVTAIVSAEIKSAWSMSRSVLVMVHSDAVPILLDGFLFAARTVWISTTLKVLPFYRASACPLSVLNEAVSGLPRAFLLNSNQ